MDDAVSRKDILKTARSLISSEGTNFTLASICRTKKLSRTQLRRVFPTKVALLAALKAEIADKMLAKSSETNTALANDGWIERRLRVLERAIKSLETRIDVVSAEQARFSAARKEPDVTDVPPVASQIPGPAPHAGVTDVPLVASQIPQLAPLAGVAYQAEEIGGIWDMDGYDPAPEPAVPPVIESSAVEPSAVSAPPVAPSAMREMLENARALAKTAAKIEIQPEKSKLANIKLVIIGAAAIVVVSLIIGLVAIRGAAPATRTSAIVSPKTSMNASNVTIINATGAAVLDQMTPDAQAIAARAEKGDASAQAQLALAYLRGDGVHSDPVAAAGWARLASAKGQPQGQFILGTLYNSGIKADARMGFQWTSAAALNGNVKAMHNVAVAFVNGFGIEKNPVQAANWFKKAASMGYRDSAFDLAVLYERGEGVAQSTQRALYWYEKAASAGDKEAAQRASLLRFGVPEIAENLDIAQRKRVSRLQ